MLHRHSRFRCLVIFLALGLSDLALGAASATEVLPLVSGDEPIVVTAHQIKTAKGTLNYEARAGRLPIRNDESGEVRGYIFFVAYVQKTAGPPRPLTFIWNGGPTSNSLLVHTEMFGPRRLERGGFVDNAETLLRTSDLVFMDPVGQASAGLRGRSMTASSSLHWATSPRRPNSFARIAPDSRPDTSRCFWPVRAMVPGESTAPPRYWRAEARRFAVPS